MQTQETIPFIKYLWTNADVLVIKDSFHTLIIMQNKTVALLLCFFIVRNEVSELTVNPLGFYILYADNKHK